MNDINRTCSNCGTSLRDFISSAFLGCENCYHEFEMLIDDTIIDTNNEIKNEGKVPFKFIKDEEIKNIENLLDLALTNQDLEQINRLSRKLKVIKEGR